ncbi:beta-lactamase family protein [Cellulomonas sp. ACRRI]|uniref:serine hydrolase domain-containing protein n=1 Tax=Cellulomonas sp. ACRRI TaxID=2918188 RepID=UPI001EF2F73E|nr:serine hydrolase domain-containing protein [Cellulomonas sp. ACRRI]MCG7287980.1 beta-lactamase family protein [Cellulomonas sp. ACRRI]
MDLCPPTPAAPSALATVVLAGDAPPAVGVRGPADAADGVPATSATPFHLCSAAKTLTAVGVLRLARRGVLDLDADVRDLVALDVAGPTGPTLRQLLGHRGGVVDPAGAFEPSAGPAAATADVLAGSTAAHPGPVRVTAEPGAAFAYSDAGYCVVERAVEVATGRAFADALHDEVATPLGLTATGFWSGEPADAVIGPRAEVVTRLAASAAAGHDADGRRVAGRRMHYAGPAASGLWSSPDDLAVLLADLGRALDGRGGVLLDPDQGAALVSDPDGLGVGLGVFLFGPTGRPCVMTQGWGVGFQCQIRWYPAAHGAVAVVINADPGTGQDASVVGATVGSVVDGRGWR